jgi:hypothetical protein
MLKSEPIKALILSSLLVVFAACTFGQTDLQKVVDAEHAFAAYAAEHDIKSAFLEYLAPDGVLFLPDKINGREHWSAREKSSGLLSWAPNYADVSSNGLLGYTTGNWEFRPKGKDDPPIAFGDFITVWLRQSDRKYKFVVDIGVGHAKPEKYSIEWTSPADKSQDPNTKNLSAADVANGFLDIATNQTLKKAYEAYASSDIRMYREDKLPFLGKKAAVKQAGSEKGELTLARKSSFFGAADLSYATSTYKRTLNGKIVEKGNYMQIWKLKNDKWMIVLDIFKPVPESGK